MRRLLLIASFVATCSLACGGEDAGTAPVDEPETGAPDTSVTPDTRPPPIDTNVEDTTAPDTTTGDTTTGDTTAGDTTTGDTTTADTLVPDTTVADTAVADTVVADTAVADTAVADTAVADTVVADTAVADTAVADTAVPDTAVPDTAVPDTAFDAGASCNALTQLGDTVTINRVATAPPTLTGGGPILSGTYVLTALVQYTGAGGATGPLGTVKLTSTFVETTAGTFYGHGHSSDITPTAATQRSTTTTTISGTNSFTQTWLCREPLPLIGPLSGTYEVSGGTIKLLYTASNALYTLVKI